MYTSIKIIDEISAVFKCKHCQDLVRIETQDLIHQPKNKLNVRCTCGHHNRSVIEYRHSIRKNTNIAGIYRMGDVSSREKTGSMTVKNISWKGFKLKISSYEHCIKAHDLDCHRYECEDHQSRSIFVRNFLKVGELITIEFFLDDPKMSFISRPVNVIWLRGDEVGVELCEPEALEPSIRFYLIGLKI